MTNIENEAYKVAAELLKDAKGGEVLVVGCSTSEVIGEKIGTASDIDAALLVYNGIKKVQREIALHLIFLVD